MLKASGFNCLKVKCFQRFCCLIVNLYPYTSEPTSSPLRRLFRENIVSHRKHGMDYVVPSPLGKNLVCFELMLQTTSGPVQLTDPDDDISYKYNTLTMEFCVPVTPLGKFSASIFVEAEVRMPTREGQPPTIAVATAKVAIKLGMTGRARAGPAHCKTTSRVGFINKPQEKCSI